jgi:uncharacterized protein (TIGR03083 family)
VNRAPALEWRSGDTRIALDILPLEVLGALNRLRTRLLQSIDNLTPAQAEAQTRCDTWRAVDLVNHLADTTAWATESIAAATENRTTSIFDGFNVRDTPKRLTDNAPRDLDTARARLHAAMADNMRQVPAALALHDRLSPTPLGPQPFPVAALHVMWDTWLHERDLLLPLGITPPPHEDEVRLCVIYTLRVVGFMTALRGRELSATLQLSGATDITLRLDVDAKQTLVAIVDNQPADDATLHADAATIVDALTGRGDIATALQGPPELRNALGALARVFAG